MLSSYTSLHCIMYLSKNNDLWCTHMFYVVTYCRFFSGSLHFMCKKLYYFCIGTFYILQRIYMSYKYIYILFTFSIYSLHMLSLTVPSSKCVASETRSASNHDKCRTRLLQTLSLRLYHRKFSVNVTFSSQKFN